jgi:hypothetical protein
MKSSFREEEALLYKLGDVEDVVEMRISIPFAKARRNPPLGGSGSPTITEEGNGSI